MTGVACALSLQTIEPRAFGYTVGDVLQRRVVLDPNRDGTLDPASLPHPGRSGRWFPSCARWPQRPTQSRSFTRSSNTPEQAGSRESALAELRVVAKDGPRAGGQIGPFTVP